MALPARIHLTDIKSGESAALYGLISSNRDRLRRYFPITSQQTETLKHTQVYVKGLQAKRRSREMFCFGIRQENMLTGLAFIKNIDWRIPKCELAYFVDRNYAGKGVGTEAVRLTVEYAFAELGMQKLFLRIDPQNVASMRIAQKNGFEQEGLLRKEFRIETDELVDLAYWGKLKPI